MNCKFHPTAEAVATCGICGVGMCKECCAGAFAGTVDDEKPVCLECRLKMAEKDLDECKWYQKFTLKQGCIGTVIWIAGVCVTSLLDGFWWLGLLILLSAAIFFYGKALFSSEEKSFSEKIKGIFFNIILGTLFLPFMVISFLVSNKWKMIKIKSKIKKIKTALGNAN